MLNQKILRVRRTKPRPSLRFNSYAWAKLLYLRDRGDSEIGGFGLSAADDPLAVVDVLTVKQCCTSVTVAFDDAAVADLFDDMVDQGIPPERFGRIWIHTHPGDCPLPSGTDEATFHRVFGRTDWAVMAIVACGGASYARLSFHAGLGGTIKISVLVDYEQPFDGADWEAWEREYVAHVTVEPLLLPLGSLGAAADIATNPYFQMQIWEEPFHDGTPRARPF